MAEKKTDAPPSDLSAVGDDEVVKPKDPTSSSLAAEIAQQVLAALQKKPSSSKGESLPPTFHPSGV